jgi:outer membrane biosynthesis protein TonB
MEKLAPRANYAHTQAGIRASLPPPSPSLPETQALKQQPRDKGKEQMEDEKEEKEEEDKEPTPGDADGEEEANSLATSPARPLPSTRAYPPHTPLSLSYARPLPLLNEVRNNSSWKSEARNHGFG